ncbi:MAG: ParB family chromosome partitioning protein [Gammaproteobacteria bacterium]
MLDMGHARALLALIQHDQIELATIVVNRGLSVRETEALVKKTLNRADQNCIEPPQIKDPDIIRLEAQISEKLGAGVQVKSRKKGAGDLIISFHSSDELEGILSHFDL